MKKLSFIFVFFGFFVISASSQADYNMCQYAQRVDSVEAWTEYLESFPYGDCVPTAKARLKQYGAPIPGQYNREDARDEEACKNARLKNNIRAWRNYLTNHPDGWCRDEAQNFLSDHEYDNENEERAWRQEKERRDYNDRKQEREENKWDQREQDSNAYQTAQNYGTIEAFQAYIDNFPDGRYVPQAQMEISKLKNIKRLEDEQKKAAEAQQKQWENQQKEQKEKQAQINSERDELNSRRNAAGGRYWSKKYSGQWAYADRACRSLTEGGYNDWRLPTISELRTLVTYAACSRTYPGGECPITDSNTYMSSYKKSKCHCDGGKRNPLGDNERMWSSSRCNDNGKYWYIYFGSGSIYADKNGDPFDYNYFRCTRDN